VTLACRLRLAGAALASAVLFACAAPAWSAPLPGTRPAIPFKQEEESTAALAGRGLAVLALAALAAYGGALALKRLGLVRPGLPGLSGQARRVRLLETMRLSRRSVVHVVHYRGEELLLAESEHGVRLLSSRAEGAADV
jgi:hypothetical protein